MRRLAEFRRGQSIYWHHVVGLIRPGEDVPVFRIDQVAPGSIEEWADDDLQLLVDEGRRQVDRQQLDLENIRKRAQWLFTVDAAVLGALGTTIVALSPDLKRVVLWLFAMAFLTYGAGGAAAILAVKADFQTIHAAVLSRAAQPVRRSLAKSYARMMSQGENTVATRLSVFRQAVVFSLLGGYCGLLSALLEALLR